MATTNVALAEFLQNHVCLLRTEIWAPSEIVSGTFGTEHQGDKKQSGREQRCTKYKRQGCRPIISRDQHQNDIQDKSTHYAARDPDKSAIFSIYSGSLNLPQLPGKN
jgi:hypothetical protein